MADLRVRGLATITPKRALRLVDLRGEGLARMGADADLTSGPHELARRWARAIYDHPRKPDGIVYRARHDSKRTCAAIFDRVEPDLDVNRIGTFNSKEHRLLLADILDTYQLVLRHDDAFSPDVHADRRQTSEVAEETSKHQAPRRPPSLPPCSRTENLRQGSYGVLPQRNPSE